MSRVAIITAASKGMGLACTELLAKEGYQLAVLSRSTEIHELADRIGGIAVQGSTDNQEEAMLKCPSNLNVYLDGINGVHLKEIAVDGSLIISFGCSSKFTLFGSSLIIHLINTGIKVRSAIRALNKVRLISKPTTTLGGCIENSITKKPKNNISVVRQIAFPVSKKVICKDSSTDKPLLRASLNLLKKWIVSSTAIPNITAKTIDTPASNSIPINPNKAPAKSNGKTFGISEIISIRQF